MTFFYLLLFFLNSLWSHLPPSMLQTKAFLKMQWNCPPPPALLNCASVRKKTQTLNCRIGDLMFLLFIHFGILQYSILTGWKRFSPFHHLPSMVYKPYKTPRGLPGFAYSPWLPWTLCSPLAYKMSLTKSLLRSALEVTAGDWGLSFTQKWSEPMPLPFIFEYIGVLHNISFKEYIFASKWKFNSRYLI